MTIKCEPLECWSLAWTDFKKPYITSISSCTRRDLIEFCEKEMDMSWKKIYRTGGRAIKTVITQRETK